MSTDATPLAELLTPWRDADPSGDAAAVLDAARRELDAADAPPDDTTRATWREFLDLTRRPDFLQALPDDETRRLWADVAVAAVRLIGFSLEDLFDQRATEHPERIWLREDPRQPDATWTYKRARRKARAYAAALLAAGRAPRVALLTPNEPRGALCDLGCLMHGLLVTPIAPHTDAGTVTWICDSLDIAVIVSGGAETAATAAAACEAAAGETVHLVLEDAPPAGVEARSLEALTAALTRDDVDAALAAQPRFDLDDVCTVMFTSGSTGRPKGVEFSLLNLVSKRFARAAALPEVGRDEVLLSYLPLFHTFGRYLELLGTLFWGGTYVFVGNNSRDSLLGLMSEIRPTGLISIPLRWTQIQEAALARRDADGSASVSEAHLRAVVGDRLRWGLSAAGYLEPRVFRFFQRHGVDLCSGFGMTEATGGITMTPPGDYRDDSVGKPLPAVNVRLTDEGEMQISGPYIASYLGEPERPGDGSWLPTGDLFAEHEGGHLEIVDRIKDIYKNARGQTIAPRRVEQRYTEVPGIERVFLVGDHRADNVLLIVPDPDDPVLQGDATSPEARDYFHRIVTAANRDLHPYERVVDFAVLDRDFSEERDELTPKGSYKRKNIEEHFRDVIEELYQGVSIELAVGDLTVRAPRWFYRDLGILSRDIATEDGGLRDRVTDRRLAVARLDDGLVRVGDLVYEFEGDVVDLGRLARQPALWVGNPALAAFCPVRDGWDSGYAPFTPHVYLPWRDEAGEPPAPAPAPAVADTRLPRIHDLCREALLGGGERALKALVELEKALDIADHRTAELIRRRLEALARHPEMAVRCYAYRTLLLDEPSPDYREVRPKFLNSGLPFLDKETIEHVTRHGMEGRRLNAFRRRLHAYRLQLEWPGDEVMHSQFEGIFTLLADFVRLNPGYYRAVRDELVSWILLGEDPVIAETAERTVLALGQWYEDWLAETLPDGDESVWKNKVLYQDGLSRAEIDRLEEVLIGTTFLQQSVRQTTGGEVLDLREVPEGGIWIGRTAVRHHQRIYRISVNTRDGKHYDLLMVIWDRAVVEEERDQLLSTIYWLIGLSGHPHGVPVMPRFGTFRPGPGVLSLAFVSDLSVWERIREYAGERGQTPRGEHALDWRTLFVKAFATFLRGWRISGERIVPGMVTPANVAVPAPDFREGARVLSLAGLRTYESPLSLVQPMLHNFFKQTAVTYPWTRPDLELTWICDACLEAMPRERAESFLAELQAELPDVTSDGDGDADLVRFARELAAYRERMRVEPHLSSALRGAIKRYNQWERSNPGASASAREQIIDEMTGLYVLAPQGTLVRYMLYRHTWFRDASEPVREAFDVLLRALHASPERVATGLLEVSALQALLEAPDDLRVFQRMVFPHSPADHAPVLLTVGREGDRHVEVATEIVDKTGAAYTVRVPLAPAEYGMLYRLFFKAGYYQTISDDDRFFIVFDEQEQVIGGISWSEVDRQVVHLNGIVVAASLLGRGISSVLIEDCCERLANMGYGTVKTLFVLRPFFERHGFSLDRRWGGLVRTLQAPAEDDAD